MGSGHRGLWRSGHAQCKGARTLASKREEARGMRALTAEEWYAYEAMTNVRA